MIDTKTYLMRATREEDGKAVWEKTYSDVVEALEWFPKMTKIFPATDGFRVDVFQVHLEEVASSKYVGDL